MGKKKSAAPVATPAPEPPQPKQKKATSKSKAKPDTKRKPSIKRATNEKELFDFKSSTVLSDVLPPAQMGDVTESPDCLVPDDEVTELVELLTQTKPGSAKPKQKKSRSNKPKSKPNSVVDDRAHAVLFGVCVEEEDPRASQKRPSAEDDMIATVMLGIGLGLIGWGVYQMYKSRPNEVAEAVAASAPK